MSRKESSNTFTDGLIKDLNPINTPNTVLTDCLNGTLITYDGNEYNLQNERGNYALKHCKLKPNYIPVGIKEYGDILYIVSYNPLTEHTEIGSYPSPETIHDTNDLEDLEQTVESTLSGVSERINYSEIVESRQPLYVFYGASENGPNEYKLNPGDLYKISSSLSDLSIYEELKYFIFDENRKSYDITEKVTDPNQHYDENNFAHVNWDIPGWLAVQPKFAEITDFNVNIKKLVVPSYGNSHIKLSLNFQLNTEDKLYLNNLSSAVEDLKVEFRITAEGKNSIPDYDSGIIDCTLANLIDTKNGSVSFYSNDWSNLNIISSDYLSLTITAVPYVIAKTGVKVYYEKFEKVLIFNLNQKGLVSDFNIGSSHWWYNTDSTNKLFNLMFDTKGLANSSVLDQDVYLFYSIKRLDGSYVTKSDGNLYKDVLCSEWNMIGETTLEIPFEEFTQSNFTNYPSKFYAEDFYIITFDFYNTESPTIQTSTLREGISKFITASELMNGQQVALYDTVSFDTWIKKFYDSIKNKKIAIVKQSNDSVILGEPYIENKDRFDGWKNGNLKSSKYSTLVGDDDFEDLKMEEGFTIVCEASSSVAVNYGTDVSLLVGPLWNSLNTNSYAVFESDTFNSGKKYFLPYTGKLPSNYSGTLTSFAKKRIPYHLSAISPQVGVWDYTYKPLVFSSYTTCMTSSYYRSGYQRGHNYLYIDAIPRANIDKFSMEKYLEGSADGIVITDNVEFLKNLTSKFNANDVLFIGLGVGKQSNSNNWSGESLTGATDIITRVDNSGTTKYGYFAGFKRTEDSLALVHILGSDLTEEEAANKLDAWTRKLQKLICDPSTYKVGTFYNAIEESEIISNNMTLSMSGTVVFGAPVYNDKNLFSASDRNSLVDGLPSNMNLSNLIKMDGSDIINFNNCVLDKNDEVVSATLDFSSKDASINNIKSEIQTVNSRSLSQLGIYSNDSVLNTVGIEPWTTKYVEITNGAVGSLLLDLINDQIFDEKVPLYFQAWHTNNSATWYLRKYLGYTSNKYSID